MPPSVHGIYVPEDVVHLIFHEIIRQRDQASFRTAALLSSAFLYVAQLHLYRSFKLSMANPTSIRDITTLLDIIDRYPYISTFIKEFSIIDLPQKFLRHRYQVGRKTNGISLQDHDYQHQNFLEIFTLNEHNLLPRLCRVLPSLSTLIFSFQRSQVDWHTLHADVKMALERLFSQSHLVTARLSGVVNIPSSISNDIFTLPEIKLSDCHFALPSYPPVPLCNIKTPTNVTRRGVRRLCMDLGSRKSNFEHVVWQWRQYQVTTIPEVCLSICGWHGSWDAAVVLATLGRRVKELSLSTTQLELAFVQQQPPKNPFLYPSARLPRIHSHAIGECFATEDCDHLTTNTTTTTLVTDTQSDHHSWFLELMSPLRPRFLPRSFQLLHKLKFEISHWRSALKTETNQELFWLIHWLAELPLETSQKIQTVSILIHVGTDFCLDNPNAITELIGYHGWGLLDIILGHDGNWMSLEKVEVMIRSRMSCVCEVEEKLEGLFKWLRVSMLPVLNGRGIVDVTYVPLE